MRVSPICLALLLLWPSISEAEPEQLVKLATFGEPRFRHPREIVSHVGLGDGSILTSAEDRRLRLWDEGGALLKVFPPLPEKCHLLPLPDKKHLLGVDDRMVSVVEIASGKVVRSLRRHGAIALGPGKEEFANSQGIWNWKTGEKVRDFKQFLPSYGGTPRVLTFSDDGKLAYVSMSRRVRVWNLEAGGKFVGKYHDWELGGAVTSPDKKSFVASRYGEIVL